MGTTFGPSPTSRISPLSVFWLGSAKGDRHLPRWPCHADAVICGYRGRKRSVQGGCGEMRTFACQRRSRRGRVRLIALVLRGADYQVEPEPAYPPAVHVQQNGYRLTAADASIVKGDGCPDSSRSR